MLNQVVMVGRLTRDPEVKESEDGKKYSNITLAVQRGYKNADGVYDTDFVDCILWNGVASNTAEYCHKGDVIGVKGRIQVSNYEKDGENRKRTEVVAEKLSFLSSSKEKNDGLEEDNSNDMEM